MASKKETFSQWDRFLDGKNWVKIEKFHRNYHHFNAMLMTHSSGMGLRLS